MAETEEKLSLDNLAVAAIRSLAIDEINKANSGHPGMALDAAPALYVLWKNHLISDPANPNWINRDRFILSAGHASALLYALLHLGGYGLTMDDLKSFRQLNSLTPGHPEFGHTTGVDATAGPLGQGLSQAVGEAIAESAVSAQYADGKSLMDHFTYCLCGDGCLEEGLGQEAISLAGHLHLAKLILFYDENGSTLDGPTSNSLTENISLRFRSSEWNVLEVKDGNDLDAIDKAIVKAKTATSSPTAIILHTVIGYGSPVAGSNKAHGTPLGVEGGKAAKAFYGYDYPDFTVPEQVYDLFKATFAARGAAAYKKYRQSLDGYAKLHPTDFKVFSDAIDGNVKPYLPSTPIYQAGFSEATRSTSGKILLELHKDIPFLFGGCADVAESVKTVIPDDPGFSDGHRDAKTLNFGIREFGMAGAQNGIQLHRGLRSYVGCFLVFSDYMKSAIRMSCIEHIPAIYLFSHDSIAVGEDGPTHEPIEQLSMLRTTPGLRVYRPADARETWASWKSALTSSGTPTAIILSRQNLPVLEFSSEEATLKGAYLISKASSLATLEIIAAGSEVSLAVDAQKLLAAKGIFADVISMPCTELFDAQGDEYRASVLPLPKTRRWSLEMGSTALWYKYADHPIGIDEYGRSAPTKDVLAFFKFTAADIAERIERESK